MPDIQLITKDNSQFEFSPADYFLFPTSKTSTQASVAWYGLQWIDVTGFGLETAVKDSTFYLGMLFHKKYQFTVSFDYSTSIPQMLISIPSDPIEDSTNYIYLAAVTIVIVSMIWVSYSQFKHAV